MFFIDMQGLQFEEARMSRVTVKIVPVKEFSGLDFSGLKGLLSRNVPVQTSLAGSILKDSWDSWHLQALGPNVQHVTPNWYYRIAKIDKTW